MTIQMLTLSPWHPSQNETLKYWINGIIGGNCLPFVCSLTHKPLVDPVVLEDGWSYEREAIKELIKRRYLNKHGRSITMTSPSTGRFMGSNNMITNVAVKNLIQQMNNLIKQIPKRAHQRQGKTDPNTRAQKKRRKE